MNWEEIATKARDCVSKQSWEALFSFEKEPAADQQSSRLIAEVFKLIHADPQSSQYNARIWIRLIQGALASWDLKLAVEICACVEKQTNINLIITVARAYQDAGFPQKARVVALRGLRHATVTFSERTNLELIVCQSYADEGNRKMAVRYLNKLGAEISAAKLDTSERAQFVSHLARVNFFLGRYPQAAAQFEESFKLYRALENWFEATRSVFNAASSFFNAGGKYQNVAFSLVEECRKLAEAHQFLGPLSHVEALYGHDEYWHGNFTAARDHFRRALKFLPNGEQSFRTLHILSMLSFTFLKTGQWRLAKQFGHKTLQLAQEDQSARFRSRYDNLEAELLWEDGQLERSQSILTERTAALYKSGVSTLEELSKVSRLFMQGARLGDFQITDSILISDQLKRNDGDWIELLHARGHLALGRGEKAESEDLFEQCLNRARQYGDRYHTAAALLGKIQTCLRFFEDTCDAQALMNEFEVALGRLCETPLHPHTYIARAALSYREGDFAKCVRFLETAVRHPRLNFADKLCLENWIATASGRSLRLLNHHQQNIISGLTKIYFKPSLVQVGQKEFVISKHYHVDLGKHPAVGEILEYLVHRHLHAASPEEIQVQVYHQRLTSQGWEQKIRNSIKRLRDLLPYTLAPLLLHDETIHLFSDAIEIQASMPEANNTEDLVMALLSEGPLSSTSLATRIRLSSATTKRMLAKLLQNEKITMMKLGRQRLYQLSTDQRAH